MTIELHTYVPHSCSGAFTREKMSHDIFSTSTQLELKLNQDGPWVAGGAARKFWFDESLDTDIDIFFKTKEQFLNYECAIAKFCKRISSTKYANTYLWNDIKVQLIKYRFFKDIESLLNDFDFTICQYAFDGQNMWYSQKSMNDSLSKILVFNNVKVPIQTLRRVIKFEKQGFKTLYDTTITLCKSIAAASIVDPERFSRMPNEEPDLEWDSNTVSVDRINEICGNHGIEVKELIMNPDSYDSGVRVIFKTKEDLNLFKMMLDNEDFSVYIIPF